MLNPVGPLADQRKKLRTRFFFLAETAEHRRRDRGRVLFFDTAHHHAEMAGLDDDSDSLRLDDFLNCFRDLRGEAFLYLEPARKDFNQPWNLAEPDHPAFGDVRHVDLAEERQHVVLAQAEHFYVFDDDHLVIIDGEQSLLEHGLGIFAVTLGQELHRFVDALRRAREAFAGWVLAETNQSFLNQIFKTGAG